MHLKYTLLKSNVFCILMILFGLRREEGGQTFRTLHFSLMQRVSLTSNTGYSSVLQHYFYQVPHPPDPPLPSPGESRLPEFWIELLFATELSYLKVVLVSPPAEREKCTNSDNLTYYSLLILVFEQLEVKLPVDRSLNNTHQEGSCLLLCVGGLQAHSIQSLHTDVALVFNKSTRTKRNEI